MSFAGFRFLKHLDTDSPGSQSVLITTARGNEVIEGLCGIKENFEPRIIPPAYHTDLLEVYDSLTRLRGIADHITLSPVTKRCDSKCSRDLSRPQALT